MRVASVVVALLFALHSLLVPLATAKAHTSQVQSSQSAASRCCARGIGLASSNLAEVVTIPINQQLSVQVLQGTAAYEHIQTLKQRRPAALKDAGKKLAALGYQPTDVYVVVRTLRTEGAAASNVDNFGSNFHLQHVAQSQEFQNEDGEMVTMSWDDGDDSTWEGTWYVERYSDGSWKTMEGQLDIADAPPYAIWSEVIGQGKGGGNPPVNANPDNNPFLAPASSPQISLASLASFASGANLQDNGDWGDWAQCAGAGCLGCLAECIYAGPYYWGCVAACCALIALICALDEFFF